MHLRLNGIELTCVGTERWGDLLSELPDGGEGALGIAVKGRTCSLNDPVEEYARASVVTYSDNEGRRIYERSLQLVLLTAAERLYPGQRVRIRHSLGCGYLVELPGLKATAAIAQSLKAEMTAIADANLPIRRRQVTLEEARTYFARKGQTDRVRILEHRRAPYYVLYGIDELKEYFNGEMAVNTGAVRVFDLVAYNDALALCMPDVDDPARPAAFRDSPTLLKTYSESARWHAILSCENVADLDDMIAGRELREFIRVNEALHERKIQQIADQFIASGARLLLIAGPSSSGKTTFSHRLSIALRVQGLRPVKVSLDDYYIDRSKLPRESDGSVDLETIDALDVDLLCDHLPRLLAGETVDMPEFDFVFSRRTPHTHKLTVEAGQPIIIEGIHGLNGRLTASVPDDMKFKVYISPLTVLSLDDHNRIRTTDVRLLRRIVRDYKFRGTPPEETMDMWPSVRRGEERYIFPFTEHADSMFNSTLTYELAIMKKYAYPELASVQPDSPHYTQARQLVKFLNYIETADVEDEIPVNSILREFIGGCCFYREND